MARTNTNSRAAPLTIGALSDQTGVNIETIRYYERVGLLPAPRRSSGRHRLYDDLHRKRLVFIRRARELGFSQPDVRALLGLGAAHGLTCGEVKALTDQHLTAIRERVRDLKRLEAVLRGLAARCEADETPTCPILETLGAED